MANLSSFMNSGRTTGQQTKTQPNMTSKSSLLNFMGQGSGNVGQQHLNQPGQPNAGLSQSTQVQFKDTPQGQKYRNVFAQSDPSTKAMIFQHLTKNAQMGNQRSYDQLNAIRDLVGKPAQNPVKVAPAFNNHLLNAVSNAATNVIGKPLASTVEGVLGSGSAGERLDQHGHIISAGHDQSLKSQVGSALSARLLVGAPGEKYLGEAASKIPGIGKVASTAAKTGHQIGSFNAASGVASGDTNIGHAAKNYGEGFAGGAVLGVGGKALGAGASALGKALTDVKFARSPVSAATKSTLAAHLQASGQSAAADAVKSAKTVGGVRVALEHSSSPDIAASPINKLVAHEEAPNKGAILGYKNAIQDGKPIEPIKVKIGSDGQLGVEDGKHRLAAYKELGFKEVPVQEVSVPKTEGPITPAASEKASVAQSQPTEKTLLQGEQGAVSPGQAIKDVQGLVTKHRASAPFSEDITQSANAVEGNKKIIQNDAAGVLKNRQQLTREEKATLQEYRDRQAAGLDTKPLPDKLMKEHQATTALNLEAQKSQAELARLNGQEAKARKIEAGNPDTYTHRVAQGKGSAFDYLLQGDRKSPLQVSRFGKTTPSSKARVFHAVTDEQGNRRLVAIKNSTTKVEGKTVARGKLVTAIDENGKGTTLGKLKMQTNEELQAKDLKPLQNQVAKLVKEQNILSATKSRTAAASTRLANIEQQLKDVHLKINDVMNSHAAEEPMGKVFVGNDGKKYTVGQATASEITAATGQKYYVDPQLTALANYVESRSALENARFIDHIKTSPDFENFGVGPDATAPKGWKPVNGMMQFQGYRFEPRVAEALNDIAKNGNNEKDILDATGRFLRQTIVYFPLKHDLNMLGAYAVDRGLSNAVNPFALKRMGSSLYQAIHEVSNQGPLYQKALRAGFSMPSADTKAFEEAFNSELKKVIDNKSVLDPIAKQILTTPKRIADTYSKFQHTTVWELQDILNLARAIERTQSGPLKKGMSFEDALKQTEKFNFQYKVPSRVAGSRQLSRLLTSDKVFFGRYRYDQWKILSNIVKDSVNLKNPAQAAQSWDKLAVLTLGAAVMWPLVDRGLQAWTGVPNAKITAPGPLGIPEQIINAATGKGNWRTAVTNQLYLSGALSLGIQIYDNRDSFTGKNISDPNASPGEQAKQALAWIGTQMAPTQKFQQVKSAGGNTLLNAALSLSGVSFPKNNAASQKVSSLQFDSLPLVQAQAKALAVKGDKQGAQKAIDKYDQQVLAASKEAFKQAKKPAPPDDQLIKSLKQQHIWYAPKQKTIDGWTAPAPKGSLTDRLSAVKKSKK